MRGDVAGRVLLRILRQLVRRWALRVGLDLCDLHSLMWDAVLSLREPRAFSADRCRLDAQSHMAN